MIANARKQEGWYDEDASRERVFEFLDNLRESGETNMFGAVPYIEGEFNVDQYRARKMLQDWMDSWEERHK